MILDSSALVAIMLKEPEAERLISAIAAAPHPQISAATVVEAGIVLSHRLRYPVQDDLEILFKKLGVSIVPFTDAERVAALEAWWTFGKTRGAAKLNFGDCIAYATAQVAGAPLLFKGEDFKRTDVLAAKW
jgi:ribonuclease VapC